MLKQAHLVLFWELLIFTLLNFALFFRDVMCLVKLQNRLHALTLEVGTMEKPTED